MRREPPIQGRFKLGLSCAGEERGRREPGVDPGRARTRQGDYCATRIRTIRVRPRCRSSTEPTAFRMRSIFVILRGNLTLVFEEVSRLRTNLLPAS